MDNVKRPTINETDEDLLKANEVFFKEKQKPAARIVYKDEKQKEENVKSVNIDFNQEKYISKSDIAPQSDTISDVKERNAGFSEPFQFVPPSLTTSDIDKILKKKIKSKFAEKKSKSIFSQMLDTENVKESKESVNKCALESSVLVDGSGLSSDAQDEVKRIHDTNMAIISSKSREEILHCQEQLKAILKPEILEFIKCRKSGKQKSEEMGSIPPYQISNSPMRPEILVDQNFESSDEILRKEGNQECDALILQKFFSSQQEKDIRQNTNDLKMCEKSAKIEEIPKEAKELLEKSNKGEWRNMDKIEKEKLAWMTDLPQPKAIDVETGYTARFNFEGKLMNREINVSSYEGLHHHGDEPEAAGYSLEELFLLARSTLQSQRITALHTLAHILENNWFGMMDECFYTPLLPMVLDAGIVPLLRWALDDTSLTSISATITAIHSLIICKADEACLHKTFCWLMGHLMPELEPQGLEETYICIEELTDADLIKLDVIKGFLRMDILPRFNYILQVLCPPPSVCKLIIEICTRVCSHSSASATQVAQYPGLLEQLFKKFLPMKWHFVDVNRLTDTVGYSYPIPAAMKLMRTICSSSKELALYLVQKFDLLSIITFYLTLQPVDSNLLLRDVQMLMIETLKTWQILLCYEIGFNVFLDLFPIFIKQLDFCLSLNLNEDESKHIADCQYAAHLYKAFEGVAVVAANQPAFRESTGQALNFVVTKSLVCLKKWLWQFSQENITDHGSTLLSTCLNFVSTFYKKAHEGQLVCEDWEPCSAVKGFINDYLLIFLKSKPFKANLKKISSYSLFLSSAQSGNKRDSRTIISLGSILWKDDVVPPLRVGSPFPVLFSILNCIAVFKNLFNNFGSQDLNAFLCDASIASYLIEISSRKLKVGSWFARFETLLIYQLLQLSSFVICSDVTLWHRTAIALLPTLRTTEESFLEDIFINVIFNKSFILYLSGSQSGAIENPDDKKDFGSIISRLPVIAKCFLSCLTSSQNNLYSKNFVSGNCLHKVSTLSNPKTLVPNDWFYIPIANIHQRTNKSEPVTPEEVLQVLSCLEWTQMCHAVKLDAIKSIPASVEFCYLCVVFLMDEDLFLEEKISSSLRKSLLAILKYKRIKLKNVKWNNFNGFDDLYLELLNQFEAVSYGDNLFGNFVLIPIQQCYPKRWKKILLTDHVQSLHFLGVPLSEVIVPLKNYLEPLEEDTGILKDYLQVLTSGALTQKRSPLLYLMAVHHLHQFLFMCDKKHAKMQKILLERILNHKNKDVSHRILLYENVNLNYELGFSLKRNLPSAAQHHLNCILGSPVNIF